MCVFNMLCLVVYLLLLSTPTQAQNGVLPWGTGTPPAWATTKEGIMSKMMGSDTTSFWTVKAAAEAYLAAHPGEYEEGEEGEGGSFVKKYALWTYTWADRVGPTGNMVAAVQAYRQIAQAESVCNDGGTWTQLGPYYNNIQRSGIVSMHLFARRIS